MSTPRSAISVLIADDEPHVVEYLRTVLHLEGFDVADSAATGDEAVQLADRLQPDVVLLDLHMPSGGLQAVQLLGSVAPTVRIVIFTSDSDADDLLPLLRSGIDGYVLKGSPPERISEAIRSAVRGEKLLAPSVTRTAVDELAMRLQAEQQAELVRDRERSRVDDLITNRRFNPVHQPIVDLQTGATVAVEALTRFSAIPAQPPDQWFAAAERVGRRIPLELAAARAAIEDLRHLAAPLRMTINVSPATAVSGRLAEVLTGAPLDRVILELTEHSPVTDYRALNAALSPWRDKGARLAVDDAGGGYSSFTHILSMSPEYIKFDMSLTREIHLDHPRQALARALVGFATEMGVGVVAEGIETEAELEVVKRLGTPYGQGFHLGRPKPLDEQPELRVDGGFQPVG